MFGRIFFHTRLHTVGGQGPTELLLFTTEFVAPNIMSKYAGGAHFMFYELISITYLTITISL